MAAARARIEAEYDWSVVTRHYAGALAEFCGISLGSAGAETPAGPDLVRTGQ